MLLRVPESIHESALANEFRYVQMDRPVPCSNCDRGIPRFDWTYCISVSGTQQFDFWCASCVETALPALLSAGRAPR